MKFRGKILDIGCSQQFTSKSIYRTIGTIKILVLNYKFLTLSLKAADFKS